MSTSPSCHDCGAPLIDGWCAGRQVCPRCLLDLAIEESQGASRCRSEAITLAAPPTAVGFAPPVILGGRYRLLRCWVAAVRERCGTPSM